MKSHAMVFAALGVSLALRCFAADGSPKARCESNGGVWVNSAEKSDPKTPGGWQCLERYQQFSAYERCAKGAWNPLNNSCASAAMLSAPKAIPADAPDPLLSSPLPGERFVAGETISLRLRAVGGTPVLWVSNVLGKIGEGAEAKLNRLPPGSHEIAAMVNGQRHAVTVRVYKDLGELYQAPPSQAELKRAGEDFAINWIQGAAHDERWPAETPLVFNQGSLEPSKTVLLSRLETLRHQAFSEPLPFGDGSTAYDHLRKYVKAIDVSLGCGSAQGGGGRVRLNRFGALWWNIYASGDCKTPVPNETLAPYVGSLYLLMHEARHSEPGDTGHTACLGQGNMDASLERGSGHARAVLYLMWVYKYGLYDPPEIKSAAASAAISLLKTRFCERPASSHPKIQALIDELLR